MLYIYNIYNVILPAEVGLVKSCLSITLFIVIIRNAVSLICYMLTTDVCSAYLTSSELVCMVCVVLMF